MRARSRMGISSGLRFWGKERSRTEDTGLISEAEISASMQALKE